VRNLKRKLLLPSRVGARHSIPLEDQLVVWRMANTTCTCVRIQGELVKISIEISATSIWCIFAVELARSNVCESDMMQSTTEGRTEPGTRLRVRPSDPRVVPGRSDLGMRRPHLGQCRPSTLHEIPVADSSLQQPLYCFPMPLLVDVRLDALARLGRALADPTRCRLLLALLDGPAYPSELAAMLELTRANTSNHLACLRGCGIVLAEPEGRQVRYSLVDANLAHALTDLADVVLATDADQYLVDLRRTTEAVS